MGQQSMALLSQTQLSDFTLTFHFHALEKGMATHSSILAWEIAWTEKHGCIQSMGWQELDMTESLNKEEINIIN